MPRTIFHSPEGDRVTSATGPSSPEVRSTTSPSPTPALPSSQRAGPRPRRTDAAASAPVRRPAVESFRGAQEGTESFRRPREDPGLVHLHLPPREVHRLPLPGERVRACPGHLDRRIVGGNLFPLPDEAGNRRPHGVLLRGFSRAGGDLPAGGVAGVRVDPDPERDVVLLLLGR